MIKLILKDKELSLSVKSKLYLNSNILSNLKPNEEFFLDFYSKDILEIEKILKEDNLPFLTRYIKIVDELEIEPIRTKYIQLVSKKIREKTSGEIRNTYFNN